MTFRHVMVSLAAVSGLAACSGGDTIVSLNVSATDAVPVVSELRVTITQGSREHVARITPPTETPTGDMAPPPSIKNTFFERIKLPDGWENADAVVDVVASDEDGSAFVPPLGDETTVKIRPEGVVAAYVQLDIPAPGTGGSGGAGGASAGGAGGESAGGAGGESAGGSPSSAGATGEAGSGAGAPAEGGAGGAAGASAVSGAGGA
jgi:hypothetical protein